MATLRVPGRLRSAARCAAELADWVALLPDLVDDLARRWGLRVGPPFEPGGSCSWVAPARLGDGRELVLKLGWRHPEAEHEAAGLRLWDGRGAVRLVADAIVGPTSALLIERCVPGTPLGAVAPEHVQDELVAGLLRRLWLPPPVDHGFRHLSSRCADWAAEFEQRVERAPRDRIDPGSAAAAIAVLRELSGPAPGDVLLCTDLHAGNVLAAQREPWLMIDPKPHVGDPAYDVVQHLLNCTERLAADPWGLPVRMARLVAVDPGRVRAWLFARCVQESLDEPALGAIAGRLLR